jgi:ABC-type glycerol-3-phosphate transport system permease component
VVLASVIATLPMLVIFSFLGRRYLVEGNATTGRKG